MCALSVTTADHSKQYSERLVMSLLALDLLNLVALCLRNAKVMDRNALPGRIIDNSHRSSSFWHFSHRRDRSLRYEETPYRSLPSFLFQ